MNHATSQNKFSFAVLMAGLLMLVLLVAVTLISVVTSYFSRRSVEELSDRIVVQILERVELQTDSVLREAMAQNAQTAHLLAGGQLAEDDFTRLSGYLASSLAVLNDMTYLGLGREANGDYLIAEHLPDKSIRLREYDVDGSGQRIIRVWRWLDGRRQLVETTPWDGYDPRQRPFYQSAATAGASVWTDTYMFWKGNENGSLPGVSFATPFYNDSGKLRGVINSDFDMDALCNFLAGVRKEMSGGYPFVVEQRRDGTTRVIAHPDRTMLLEKSEGTNLSQLRDVTAATFVQSVLNDEKHRDEMLAGKIVRFDAGGEHYFGGVRRLAGADMPNWTVVAIIPVNEVMGGVYENDRRAFWLGILCVLLSVPLAIFVARRVAQPLWALTNDAKAIGRLELESKAEPATHIREVSQLASSMSDMKLSLRSFQKFVPTDIIRDIFTNTSEAGIGGKRVSLTLFFSDIADFTSMAEGTDPEALVKHLGEYLGAMSDIIQANHGTVDKFLGDGIMAFWGAPRTNPHHARDACKTALDCQAALAKLNLRWQAAGTPPLPTRIGLHTGSVIVGNIGSEKRLNYTAVGDSVNLASRLEGLGKFYGKNIIISATTRDAAGDSIVARPVDKVSVKGRIESICVYELLAMAGQADENTPHLAALTAKAFDHYLRGEFKIAHDCYQALLDQFPGDSVARMMCGRCQEYAAAPTAGAQVATFQMKEK